MQRVPPFSYSIFIVRYKTGRDYRVRVFSALCNFFSKFFVSPKSPPSSFLIFYSKLKFQKAQRVFPFKFFGTMRLAQNSHFSIFFQKTQRVPFLQFQKVWAFWALDMAPTLDVPVLLLLADASLLQSHKMLQPLMQKIPPLSRAKLFRSELWNNICVWLVYLVADQASESFHRFGRWWVCASSAWKNQRAERALIDFDDAFSTRLIFFIASWYFYASRMLLGHDLPCGLNMVEKMFW